jgi:hypothetical protein
MITFSRSQVIGAEFLDEDTIRFNGIQEDHIYGMEVQLEVRVSDGKILKVDGEMKRYTNFVCPQAIPVLQTAVGLSLLEDGWDKQVMREIGRKGCEHFAEIIIECGRCLKPAKRAKALHEAIGRDSALDQVQFLDGLPG